MMFWVFGVLTVTCAVSFALVPAFFYCLIVPQGNEEE